MDFTEFNFGVIYLITGPNPEHKYIGQTKMFRINYVKNKLKYFDYKGRFKEHIVSAKYKPTHYVDKIIQTYGPENFSVKLIGYCEIDKLDHNEVKCIQKFNTLYPNGLNIILGNPHKNCNKERTSQLLKQHYSSAEIKLKHSLIHRSNFKDIDVNNIKNIEIKPIKQGNENKIAYMYIHYENGTTFRRRYGGIHESFNESYNRCLNDATILIDQSKIMDFVKNKPKENLGNVVLAELKIHKINKYELVSIYITNTEVKKWDEKKRFVFGGKTIKLIDAYYKAVEFIKNHNIETEKIMIHSSILATLPNCWDILRA
jgi:hypothetical protein